MVKWTQVKKKVEKKQLHPNDDGNKTGEAKVKKKKDTRKDTTASAGVRLCYANEARGRRI